MMRRSDASSGAANHRTARISIKIDGFISAEAAKAGALEVIADLGKAGFGQATKGT
jgi:hypothetical protein